MKKLEVFEPAMCCPTGVCGVEVDPVMVQFNADLQALSQAGVEIVRHSLSHDAAAFAGNADVVKEMAAGMDRLPIVTVDGRIVSTGIYPSKVQLMSKLGLAIPTAEKPRVKLGECGCAPGKCC
ncbi:MAG: arsenite efflux transporter metallochaperone ArsD [Pseudomonadota bacterium]